MMNEYIQEVINAFNEAIEKFSERIKSIKKKSLMKYQTYRDHP